MAINASSRNNNSSSRPSNSGFGSGGRSTPPTVAAQRTRQSTESRGGFGSLQNVPKTQVGGGNRATGSGFGTSTLKPNGVDGSTPYQSRRTTGTIKEYDRQVKEERAREAARRSVPNTPSAPTTPLTMPRQPTQNTRPYYPTNYPVIYQQPTFWDNVKTAATYTVVSNLTNRAVNGVIDSFTGKHSGNRNNIVASEATVDGQKVYKLEDKQTGATEFYVADQQGNLIPQSQAQQSQPVAPQNNFWSELAWKAAGTGMALGGIAKTVTSRGGLGRFGGLALLAAGVATLVK